MNQKSNDKPLDKAEAYKPTVELLFTMMVAHVSLARSLIEAGVISHEKVTADLKTYTEMFDKKEFSQGKAYLEELIDYLTPTEIQR